MLTHYDSDLILFCQYFFINFIGEQYLFSVTFLYGAEYEEHPRGLEYNSIQG